MMETGIKFRSIDQYISMFSPVVQEKMETLRKAIRDAAKDAEEVISYNMPAFKKNKVLVYFAGYKNHIGFYPTPKPIIAFAKDLEKYTCSKGAVQFPLNKPIPVGLVKRMVRFRVKEDEG